MRESLEEVAKKILGLLRGRSSLKFEEIVRTLGRSGDSETVRGAIRLLLERHQITLDLDELPSLRLVNSKVNSK